MKKPKAVLILLVLCLIFAWSVAGAKDDPKNGKRVAKTSLQFNHTYFLINNIFTQFANTMESDVELTSGQNSGFEWPKGSGKTAVYESGFIYAGYYEGINPTTSKAAHRKFVNGSAYISGMTEGWINGYGTGTEPPNATYVSPGDPMARVFRVRPDISPYDTQNTPAALKEKLGLEELALIQRFTPATTAASLYDQYVKDWNEWPATQGAPFKDMNGNGTYEPAVDIPGVPGADQTLWFVCNDMVAATAQTLAGAGAQGVEIQKTIWGYNRQSALGNVYFAKWTFINKSGAMIDTMYNCFWTDIDLGYAGDDFCGVDVARQLGFNYNGKGYDQLYGDACPASGFAFFQGPVVPSVGDSGIFKGAYRKNVRNLKMSSFDMFINYTGIYQDPPQGNSTAARDQWWNLLTGHIGVTGGVWINPVTGDTTTYVLDGDPVTGTGWLDGSFAPPGDRRFCETVGPYDLAPGDTQEIVVAGMVGQGADRISSVTAIRATCDEAQAAYNNFFVLPQSCPPPNLTITPMDGSILLTWGDPADIKKIEQDYNADLASKGYKFEAYRVYQTQTQSFTSPKTVATYDIATDPVLDNNGVQHFIQITTDKFTSKPLVNGTPYYFGVSTISYNPAGFPQLLEKAPTIVQIIPQSPLLGNRLTSAIGDTVGAAHTAGIADAKLYVKVQNPTKVTGDAYQVQMVVTDSVINPNTATLVPNYKWQVYDVTKGIAASVPFNQYGNKATNAVVDGLNIGLSGSPFYTPGTEISSQTYTPAADFNWSGVNWGGTQTIVPFGGGLDIAINFRGVSQLTGDMINQTIEVRFNSASGQNAYDFLRAAATGGAPYEGFYPQPFTVWNVTDPANPVQIDFVFLEQSGNAAHDHIWAPTASSADREYFFFIDQPYTATEKSFYTGKTLNTAIGGTPAVYGGWYVLTDGTKPAYKDGDVWRISATKTLTLTDRWAFTTNGKQVTFSTANQKADVSTINVFPNPYFGFQALEQNRYQRFVTFTHLPQKATIRIFTLSGQMVRSFSKDDPSQFFAWDLKNGVGIPVASGVYIVHIDMPGIGASKILKLSVIQPQQILDHL